MTTRDETKAALEHDIEQGWIAEVRPGVFQATKLGVTQKRLEAAVSLITAWVTSSQRFALLLSETMPGEFTLDELVDREDGGTAQTGQYL